MGLWEEDVQVNDDLQDTRRPHGVHDADEQTEQLSASGKPGFWAPLMFQVFLLIAWSEALSTEGVSRDLHLIGVTAMQVLWVGWVVEVLRRRSSFASPEVR